MNKFGYTKEVFTSFPEALDDITIAMAKEGFGVLSKIDMQAKLKEKLNKDIDEYMILGACNPSLANDALESEYEIGLLLPCNVIVYKKNGKVFVSAIIPTTAMEMIDNLEIGKIAEVAEEKLKRAIDNM